MADAQERKGRSGVGIALAILLAAGLGGLVYYFHDEAEKARADLDRSKREYREMVTWRKPVEDWKRRGSGRTEGTAAPEDLVAYLDKKRGQAQIPQNVFAPNKEQQKKSGGWKEDSCIVTLRSPNKDSPIVRAWVADFLRLAEENPQIRSKDLKLAFAGQDFSQAIITFSTFQRE